MPAYDVELPHHYGEHVCFDGDRSFKDYCLRMAERLGLGGVHILSASLEATTHPVPWAEPDGIRSGELRMVLKMSVAQPNEWTARQKPKWRCP